MITDNLFDLVSYRIDGEPHIRVDHAKCATCADRACTFACPARCYEWNQGRDRLDFAHEACLECGTCLLVCQAGALTWDYPRGGCGVRYRLT